MQQSTVSCIEDNAIGYHGNMRSVVPFADARLFQNACEAVLISFWILFSLTELYFRARFIFVFSSIFISIFIFVNDTRVFLSTAVFVFVNEIKAGERTRGTAFSA
jgi:hypothetical protein